MRWNNAGIGYLDELQYEDAMNAFEQVVRLRPDYKDGYINIGLTYIEWEKYAQARTPLEKALTLHPDDARALYYMALVERRHGIRRLKLLIWKRWLRNIRNLAMRAESLAYPTTSSIAANKPWNSSRPSRQSTRMIWPRTITWQFCTAGWA